VPATSLSSLIHSFIYLFIPDISIAPSGPLLLWGASGYSMDRLLCGS